jgi:hypothetical protein
LLQREVEKLHSTLIELETAPVASPQERLDGINRRLADSKNQLERELAEATKLETELERLKFQTNLAQGRLEELVRISLQLEVQAARSVAITGTSSNTVVDTATAPSDEVIGPHDVIRIVVANAFPDMPIHEAYPVESMGTVALGPTYGRVKVAGLSILDAESAVRKHLSEMIEYPQEQVTMHEKSQALLPIRSEGSNDENATFAPNTFVPSQLSQEQFQQAVVTELAALRKSMIALSTEINRQRQPGSQRADGASILVDPNDRTR